MREIAAASDFDFVALEPPRAKKGKALQRAAVAPQKPSRLARLWRFRAPVFGGLAMTGLLGGILFNAMYLQHGRHPAPLLGGATLRIAPPAPPPRPAGISPLLNEQIPRPTLHKVVASPDAAFAAPTATLDDEPAAEAQANDAAPAPVPAPAAVKPQRPAPTAARPAAPAPREAAHGAPKPHHGPTHAALSPIKSTALPPPAVAKPAVHGAAAVKTPSHGGPSTKTAPHAAAPKKGPDPIAALLAGQAR